MYPVAPRNADDVRRLVDERLKAVAQTPGVLETVTVEWRGAQRALHVITMPVNLLSYNPDTHRLRAQRSLDPERDALVDADPFSDEAQAYLHQLLMADPAEPSKPDPSFGELRDDLRDNGQRDPGLITVTGVLVNGNTRRAALQEIGEANMRVGVLPPDAAIDDVQTIELDLQLRKDLKRDYSFMNLLLAIDERVKAGRNPADIQTDFRIRSKTFDRDVWILGFVREAIERSKVATDGHPTAALRLVDFETHQGKLEELHGAYIALKGKSPDQAEALREQRLLAMVLGRSKTDLRLIEPDFAERYMAGYVTTEGDGAAPAPAAQIPGTTIKVPAPSPRVTSLRQLTDRVLRARALEVAQPVEVDREQRTAALGFLQEIEGTVIGALDQAGRTGRLVKRRLAPVDRLTDALDDLQLCLSAIVEARATNNFDPDDLDQAVVLLRSQIVLLAQLVNKGGAAAGEGAAWLRAVAQASVDADQSN